VSSLNEESQELLNLIDDAINSPSLVHLSEMCDSAEWLNEMTYELFEQIDDPWEIQAAVVKRLFRRLKTVMNVTTRQDEDAEKKVEIILSHQAAG
jgi:type I site-specific restriction-modification system R (restriction) subunit